MKNQQILIALRKKKRVTKIRHNFQEMVFNTKKKLDRWLLTHAITFKNSLKEHAINLKQWDTIIITGENKLNPYKRYTSPFRS